jgi:hypothetical protein
MNTSTLPSDARASSCKTCLCWVTNGLRAVSAQTQLTALRWDGGVAQSVCSGPVVPSRLIQGFYLRWVSASVAALVLGCLRQLMAAKAKQPPPRTTPTGAPSPLNKFSTRAKAFSQVARPSIMHLLHTYCIATEPRGRHRSFLETKPAKAARHMSQTRKCLGRGCILLHMLNQFAR